MSEVVSSPHSSARSVAPGATACAAGDAALSARRIPVVWYNDSKEAAVEQKDAPRLGVAEILSSAQSEAERARIVSSLLHLTGFSTFAYFALEFASDRVERLFLHEAFTPSTYRGEYVQRHHFDVDPRTFGARMCNMPIVWDLRNLRQHGERHGLALPDEREAFADFLQTMRDDAMCSGIMYSMAMPGTRLHAFMSFTAPRRNRDWITSATVEQALSIGLSVHKFGSPKLIATAREHAANRLTAFEQKLLTGIAEGASDKEIGRRLDTSAHNVDYHLRKLRRRFGVSNRIELTYLTAKMELI
ncbi:LuxR family transcriptional regulator [Paraburkholderia sp. CNPSo 3157]|uniref:LuxR family transcriptional regulator n=1 Tax=Paraburkholderia franconis TaxID=2654983 RepID=A0A7X1NFI3_9BURK|nr:LuxR family transcriptional regulator [Paraburkholderia franconis]MPW20513.1 LuxR family transcriptional regulator [Paraburkholderia franconis]